MPNHYNNIVIVKRAWDLADEITAFFADCPIRRLRPMPAALETTRSPALPSQPVVDGHTNWYDWQIANWGVKWGTYNPKPAVEPPGDGCPVLISFCTPWGPPNEEVRTLIAEALLALNDDPEESPCGVSWLGVNPSNNSTDRVQEWTK